MPIKKFTIPSLSYEQITRFWRSVDTEHFSTECWPWKKAIGRGGYGRTQFRLNGIKYEFYAHRVAFALEYGDPMAYLVCHSCDNASCCNPRHLFLGNASDNMIDKVIKGRQSKGEKHSQHIVNKIQGERAHTAKLTVEDVKDIRRRYRRGMGLSLAREYGVHGSAILYIVKRKTWKHII